MHAFYSFLLFLVFLIYIPVYFVRLKLIRGESLFLKERLGFKLPVRRATTQSIWIHAVSVGEVLSLQNLIKTIKERHPDWIIHFSTLTNTGIRVAKEKLEYADDIFFVPLDFKWIVRKFFNALKPQVFVLAESEFWPNLLKEAKTQTKGVLLINGRISLRSYKRYKRFRFITKNILKKIDAFLVQTEKDKDHLKKIGVNSERIQVAGNLKSEINLPLLDERELAALKGSLKIPEEKKVIVAGSTRKGEEKMLLSAFLKARNLREDLLLILAPRQPARFNDVSKLCDDFPFKVMRRTRGTPDLQWDIMLLDTIGELAQFYALSDVAFIGGSLVPWGGHNLLEPAFYKKPIFFGPHMGNFAFLADRFVKSGAARIAHNEKDLIEMFLMEDERSLEMTGCQAKETLNSLQGATERIIKALEVLMEES